MKFIVLLFMLFLIGAWGYVSWYWYTCNIKGFCDSNMRVAFLGNSGDEDSGYVIPTTPTISIDDVTIENETSTTAPSDNTTVEATETPEEPETPEAEPETPEVCEPIITEPIQYGGQNDPAQVEALEAFINTQGTSVPIDGNYGAEDYEAVKAFQLQHRAKILDPWGLTNPTGYVYKTTMETINQVACGQ